MKNTFKQSSMATIMVTALMTGSVYAKNNVEQTKQLNQSQKAKQKEGIGFGAGAVIGAIVAGPFGAFFTSIAGTMVAKHINLVDERNHLAKTLVQDKQSHQKNITQLQTRLTVTEEQHQQELSILQQRLKHFSVSQLQAENLLMSIQFSTGSSELAKHYYGQVQALANILQSSGLTVDLSGYTDLQGDEKLNFKLSLARVNAVKEALISAGVQREKINTYAYGETAPVVASEDQQVSFYDRRVVIKLHREDRDFAYDNSHVD